MSESRSSRDPRRVYYDAEPWYLRERTGDWYQQNIRSNTAMKEILSDLVQPGWSCFEVGCGGGWLAMHLIALGVREYRGLDFAESAIEAAQERLEHAPNALVRRGDALVASNYPDAADLIVANQFLHCLIGQHRSQWLSICSNTLQSRSGSLVLSTMVGIPAQLEAHLDRTSRTNRPGNRYYAELDEVWHEVEHAGMSIAGVVQVMEHDAIFVCRNSSPSSSK